jgi:hypothetical protein
MFKIESVYRLDSEMVECKVTIDAREWTKLAKQGALGHLYGVDISNAIYKLAGVKALYPTVDATAKARNGIKLLSLTYVDREWTDAPDNVIRVDFAARRRVA